MGWRGRRGPGTGEGVREVGPAKKVGTAGDAGEDPERQVGEDPESPELMCDSRVEEEVYYLRPFEGEAF